MAMLSNVADQAKDPNFFRRLAAWLQRLPRNDWTDWEDAVGLTALRSLSPACVGIPWFVP